MMNSIMDWCSAYLLLTFRVISDAMLLSVIVRVVPIALKAFKDPSRHNFLWLLIAGLMINRAQWGFRSVIYTNLPDEPHELAYMVGCHVTSILLFVGVHAACTWHHRDE